jgi:hypothetical protein
VAAARYARPMRTLLAIGGAVMAAALVRVLRRSRSRE